MTGCPRGLIRAAHALRIARPIGVDVFEIVQLLGRDPSRRAVGVRRQRERNAVAPPSAHLGGEQLRIDLVPIRLQEILETDGVGFGHLEDRKTPVQTEFPRLWDEIVLGLVQQDE